MVKYYRDRNYSTVKKLPFCGIRPLNIKKLKRSWVEIRVKGDH